MTGYELYQGIKDLATQQGIYGRMLRNWYNIFGDELNIVNMLDSFIEDTNCKDIVDFILLIEGGI